MKMRVRHLNPDTDTRSMRVSLARRTVAEGVGTAFTVHELAGRYGVEMPVCHEVYRVLAGQIPASEAYRGLSRQLQAGHEREPG